MTEYVREGSCNRCAACCWNATPENPVVPDVQGTIEGACELLRCERDGVFHCAGWGWHPYWQAGCHSWPGFHPDTLKHSGITTCGYSYREVCDGH